MIFADDRDSAACISGPGFTSLAGSASSVTSAIPAGQIMLASSHLTNRAGAQYSFAQGPTGPGVTAETLVLDDGTHVTASSSNGWFVAWWPEAHGVASARVTSATGTATQRFHAEGGPASPQVWQLRHVRRLTPGVRSNVSG